MKRIAVLLALLALVVAACGGGDDGGSGVASLSNSTDETAADEASAEDGGQEAALIAFTECLRENGVDLEDPTVDADGNVQLGQPNFDGEANPRDVMGPAFEACQDRLDGLELGFGRPDETELQDTLYEYAACMRDNGFDMPDPDFSSFGPGNGNGEGGGSGAGDGAIGGPFGDIDPDDPAFETAQAACEDILAGFGPGDGGGFGRGPAGGGNDG
jgi:hypothetical protein